jgi:ribonuclease HI
MITLPVEMYTDGSSLRNPGAAGLGWILRYYEQEFEDSMPIEKVLEGNEGFRLSTNNRMEMMAFIYGIEKFMEQFDSGVFADVKQLNVFSDSDYLCKAINQNWVAKWSQNNWMTSGFNGQKPKPVKNKDLWMKITDLQGLLKNKCINMAITHVDGHSGHEWNERADKLATSASSQQAVKIDEEYEKLIQNR